MSNFNEEKMMEISANIETALSSIAKSLEILAGIEQKNFDTIRQQQKEQEEKAKMLREYQKESEKSQKAFLSSLLGLNGTDSEKKDSAKTSESEEAKLTYDDLEFSNEK